MTVSPASTPIMRQARQSRRSRIVSTVRAWFVGARFAVGAINWPVLLVLTVNVALWIGFIAAVVGIIIPTIVQAAQTLVGML